MKTRLPRWSVLVFLLALTLTLGCPAAPPEPPPAKDQPGPPVTKTETGGIMAIDEEEILSAEVYVLVSTAGGRFSVSPDPVVVQNKERQKVIWVTEDADALVEIEFKPKERNETNPDKEPPARPCQAKSRKCGEDKVIGGNAGRFLYTIKGSKGDATLPDFDPELIILK